MLSKKVKENKILDFSDKQITLDKFIPNDEWSDDSYIKELIPVSSIIKQITELGDTFSKLDISHNRFCDKGLNILLDTLCKHEKLKFLSIAYNAASNKGIFNFFIKILNFNSVPYVDIRGNYGSDFSCIKKVLDMIDEDKKIIFKEKIIWYGLEPFRMK